MRSPKTRLYLLAFFVITAALFATIVRVADSSFEDRDITASTTPEKTSDDTAAAARRQDIPASPAHDQSSRRYHLPIRVVRGPAVEVAADMAFAVAFRAKTGNDLVTMPVAEGKVAAFDLLEEKYFVELPNLADHDVWPNRIQVTRNPPTDPITLTIVRRGAVLIDVVDADGNPVPSIIVSLKCRDIAHLERNTITDKDGIIRRDVPAAAYDIDLQSNDFTLVRDGESPEATSLVVLPGSTPTPKHLVVKKKVWPTIKCRANVLVDDVPVDPKRLRDLRVIARNRTLHPRMIADGLFVTEEEVRDGRPTAPGKATLIVRGNGLADAMVEIDDPGEESVELVFECRMKSYRGKLQGTFVDQTGKVLPGERLDLMVLEGPQSTTYAFRSVVTDDNGRFSVPGVEMPCEFFVANQPDSGRILPRETKSMRVFADDVVRVVKEARHRVLLDLSDKSLAQKIARDAKYGFHLSVVPIADVGEIIADRHSDGLGGLTDDAMRSLRETGTVDLGDLPFGRYRATLFAGTSGTFTTVFEVAQGNNTIPVELATATQRSEISVQIDSAASGGILVDGSIPFSTAWGILGNSRISAKNPGEDRAWATIDPSGRASITIHNPADDGVTVIKKDGAIIRLKKTPTGRAESMAPAGGQVVVNVRDADGRPRHGIAVNLTSLRGGESAGTIPWPRADELRAFLTDNAGRVEITGVEPGDYILSAAYYTTDATGDSRRFEIDAKTTRVVTVRHGLQGLDLEITPRPECGVNSCSCHHDHHDDEHDHDH